MNQNNVNQFTIFGTAMDRMQQDIPQIYPNNAMYGTPSQQLEIEYRLTTNAGDKESKTVSTSNLFIAADKLKSFARCSNYKLSICQYGNVLFEIVLCNGGKDISVDEMVSNVPLWFSTNVHYSILMEFIKAVPQIIKPRKKTQKKKRSDAKTGLQGS